MRVSRNVARSIIFLHSASFVHKNIRPDTIITTETGESYLVGFQWFRAAAGDTYMLGDAVQSYNLYRHPTRQGQAPEEMYSMQHDVYSLGVCLLEIGLWKSFVTYGNAPTDITVDVPGIPEAGVQPSARDRRKHSYEVKHKLTDLAREELPSRMGERFAAVVVSCLTCLDKDSDLGSVDALLEDDNGVILGVNYIHKVGTISPRAPDLFADKSHRS
jgi:serine/threonine protein kinase